MHGKDGDKVFDQTVQQVLMGERMPEEWRRSVLIPIYKNKVTHSAVETTEE